MSEAVLLLRVFVVVEFEKRVEEVSQPGAPEPNKPALQPSVASG